MCNQLVKGYTPFSRLIASEFGAPAAIESATATTRGFESQAAHRSVWRGRWHRGQYAFLLQRGMRRSGLRVRARPV